MENFFIYLAICVPEQSICWSAVCFSSTFIRHDLSLTWFCTSWDRLKNQWDFESQWMYMQGAFGLILCSITQPLTMCIMLGVHVLIRQLLASAGSCIVLHLVQEAWFRKDLCQITPLRRYMYWRIIHSIIMT